MADLIITHGTVITMDAQRRIIKDGSVLIEGNRIVDVGKGEALEKRYQAERVIDARNKIVMPGVIDSQVHQPLQRSNQCKEELIIWGLKEHGHWMQH